MARHKTRIIDDLEKTIPGTDLLSDEERQEVRSRAKAHVLKAKKDKALEDLLKVAIREEEREFSPKEKFEDFTVNLPEFSHCLTIDGKMYLNGQTYEVPYSMARSMADQQARAWEHDREKDGYRRKGDVARDPLGRGVNVLSDRVLRAR